MTGSSTRTRQDCSDATVAKTLASDPSRFGLCRPPSLSAGLFEYNDRAGSDSASTPVARARCPGSGWRKPPSPERGRFGSGGAALRVSTQPLLQVVRQLLNPSPTSRRGPRARRHVAVVDRPEVRGIRWGEMELTFSCKNCGAVGHVSPLEEAPGSNCRRSAARPERSTPRRSSSTSSSSAHVCMTNDLYIQKDFPTGAGPVHRARGVRHQHGLLVL